jgi:hypothetical protein
MNSGPPSAAFISQNFDLAVPPSSAQELHRDEIGTPHFDADMDKTCWQRWISSDPRAAPITALPQETMAAAMNFSEELWHPTQSSGD